MDWLRAIETNHASWLAFFLAVWSLYSSLTACPAFISSVICFAEEKTVAQPDDAVSKLSEPAKRRVWRILFTGQAASQVGPIKLPASADGGFPTQLVMERDSSVEVSSPATEAR